MNHERDRREHNRRIAIEKNKNGGVHFSTGGVSQGPGEYSILNGNLVVRKKGSNNPWGPWGTDSGHLKPGKTPHGKLPANQYSVGQSNKVTLGGVTYDLSIPAHNAAYQKAQEQFITVEGKEVDITTPEGKEYVQTVKGKGNKPAPVEEVEAVEESCPCPITVSTSEPSGRNRGARQRS